MNTWIVIAAAGLGSYLFRLSMIMLPGWITTPAYLERGDQRPAARPASHPWHAGTR